MSRYTLRFDKLHPTELFGKAQLEIVYGFDTGGLLGEESPTFGFFIQEWYISEKGNWDMVSSETGDKSVIIGSQYWDDIEKSNPDHAMKIALDLPF